MMLNQLDTDLVTIIAKDMIPASLKGIAQMSGIQQDNPNHLYFLLVPE